MLLSFLYNTRARIQEALNPRPQDLHLKSPAHVKLMGKGQKERISPIWLETSELISALLRRRPCRPDETVFVNRYGGPLTASGYRFRLRTYVKAAAKHLPTLTRKRITPHVFRHTTAVHLISAAVDVSVIRSWLGNAHLDTTSHYAQASLETKRKALEHPILNSALPNTALETRCRSAGVARFFVTAGSMKRRLLAKPDAGG